MRPVIGITSFSENRSSREYNSIGSNYVNSVAEAGGIPVIIPVLSKGNIASEYLHIIDGILFTGGGDLLPSFYGEETIKETGPVSIERDKCEKELFSKAMKIDMPILGICRGMQIMNAFSGGTLYQDIDVQKGNCLKHNYAGSDRDGLYHEVSIERGSRMYDIFRAENISVNSFHHQAVKSVAGNFKITAASPDGIIEGIECTNRAFVLGVQWHPEDLTNRYPEFLELFKALTAESEKYGKANRE